MVRLFSNREFVVHLGPTMFEGLVSVVTRVEDTQFTHKKKKKKKRSTNTTLGHLLISHRLLSKRCSQQSG